MIAQYSSLTEYIAALQMSGRYSFVREEAIKALNITTSAFKFASLRLIKKNRLIRLKNSFYVIVPTEYQGVGAPPAFWYIDALMKYEEQDYYVGLLSAAALHGAAHQQPQVLQIVTNKMQRPVMVGRTRLQFLFKKNISHGSIQLVTTPTGQMNVSTPEITAVDLVRYIKPAGYLNNVATVLSELQEKFDPMRFEKLLNIEPIELAYLQRLGYLLEITNTNKNIINILKNWINQAHPRLARLRPNKPSANVLKNKDWRLYINEDIESDI